MLWELWNSFLGQAVISEGGVSRGAKGNQREKGADSCCGCLQPFQAKLCIGKGAESFNIPPCNALNSVINKPGRVILAQRLKSHGRPWACLGCLWRGDIACCCRDLAFSHRGTAGMQHKARKCDEGSWG